MLICPPKKGGKGLPIPFISELAGRLLFINHDHTLLIGIYAGYEDGYVISMELRFQARPILDPHLRLDPGAAIKQVVAAPSICQTVLYY